ncbi:unnamed protein product [Ilex paraguariensis]|uniref:FAD-binding PCMH-type domain-containing protein n=1 Tax=Ilex paraguariensis TaxID=185542 RepID=A0ABC8TZZ8_9AQUA
MGVTFALVSLFLLSVSWVSCYAASIHEDFGQCMSEHLTGKPHPTENIFTPDSPTYKSRYDAAQQNTRWVNSTVPLPKPTLILMPNNESQIQAAVLCSRQLGLQIRVKSGGHDYEGQSYLSKTPFIIIDLVNMRSIDINVEEQTAWVQTGATLGELYYNIGTRTNTLAFPGGLCPSVGTGGHISGGGLGVLLRKFGLAADNVIDASIVDVNGRILDRKTMGEDLFWAIRGGGGASFGVILSWKLKLVQIPATVTYFNIGVFGIENVTKLVYKWQRIAHKLPKDLFIRGLVATKKTLDENKVIKDKTIKVQFESLFLGSKWDLIPLLNKTFPELGVKQEDLQEMTWVHAAAFRLGGGDETENTLDMVLLNRTDIYRSSYKGKSDFVTTPISPEGLEGIWEKFLEEDTQVYMIIDPFGGQMDNISKSALPFPHRKGTLYNIQYLVKWYNNNATTYSRHQKWMKDLYEYMAPYVSQSPRAAYLNYKDLDLSSNQVGNTSYAQAKVWGEKYFKGNFERLARVKSMVDPSNFFRNEQSIPLLPTKGTKQFH